ncbi:MAG: hypothetical protein WBA42_13110 [Mesorhizobium sp.]
MSEYDDYTAGLAGCGRRDSSAFRAGEARRYQKEMDPIIRDIMTPKTAVPEAASPHYLDQPATSQHAGAGTYEPGMFDAWDRSPWLSFLTFIVAVALCLTFICPAFDAAGILPETFARIVVLGSLSLFLSAWTNGLPFISAGGFLLLMAHHMLFG